MRFTLDKKNWIAELPSLAFHVLGVLHLERDIQIIKRRFGFTENKRSYTLQQIGNYYGISRERVRQLLQRGLLRIQQTLLRELQLPEIDVPVEVTNEFISFQRILSERAVITLDDVIALLRNKGHIKVDSRHLAFLLEIYGFQRIPNKVPGTNISLLPCWVTDGKKLKKKELYNKIVRVYRFLQRVVVLTDAFEILANLNHRRAKIIRPEDLEVIAHIVPYIQNVGNQYQLTFEKLPSLADKAYRVLSEHGSPMHLKEIAREINRRLAQAKVSRVKFAKLYSLQKQLVTDERFAPVGRGGYWKLVEWDHVVSATIIELMQNCLHEAGEPKAPEDIYLYVHARRPDASKRSVTAYLNSRKDIFVEVEKHKFGLQEWYRNRPHFKKPQRSTFRDQIQQQILEILGNSPAHEVSLTSLRERVVPRVGCASSTFYRYLSELEESGFIRKYSISGEKRVALVKEGKILGALDLEQVILRGETGEAEFKMGAIQNTKTGKKDPKMLMQVVETVAAFMNSSGGILILGVDDDGQVLGIEREYPLADPKKQNRDGYELVLRNILTQKLGIIFLPYFSIHFQKVHKKELCYIVVDPAPQPVYVNGDLIVRNGNQKLRLKAQDAINYIKRRWRSL